MTKIIAYKIAEDLSRVFTIVEKSHKKYKCHKVNLQKMFQKMHVHVIIPLFLENLKSI